MENHTNERQTIFAICGIVGPILFTVLVIIESLLRPGYSQIFNDVSDLGLGPYSLIQNINFIIFGILSIGLALGLGNKLPYRAGKATKWLITIFGICIILAGVTLMFTGNGVTYAKDIESHGLVSAIAFLTIIIAQFTTWQSLRGSKNTIWKNYRIYSLQSGILSIITLIFLSYTQFTPYHGARKDSSLQCGLYGSR